MLHIKHCRKNKNRPTKQISKPVKIGAKTLAGAGVGMAAVFLASAASSLVGGAVLLHAALYKIGAGAGLMGGGIGLAKGLSDNKKKKA
jgi:hypothetical protein